jgi:hypothetical protein
MAAGDIKGAKENVGGTFDEVLLATEFITTGATAQTKSGALTVGGVLTSATYNIGTRQMVSMYSWGGDNANVWLGGATNNTVTGTEVYHGNYLVAIGVGALYANTTGFNNNAIGAGALYANTTGNYNNAIGVYALRANTAGSYNNAIGVEALRANTTGSYNNAIGVEALREITVGSSNTALGYNTGRGITTGSNNTIIGARVTGLATTLTDNIILSTGQGTIRAQFDGTKWTLGSALTIAGALSGATTGAFSGAVTAFYVNIGGFVSLIGDETGLLIRNQDNNNDPYPIVAKSIATDANEAIAFDVITHTIGSSEDSAFTETWSKATAANVVSIICQYYDGTHYSGEVPNQPNLVATFTSTTLSVDDLNSTMVEGDKVKILITYLK